MANEIRQFLRDHGISEVEAIIPDMAGIARGKIMPAEKFAEDEGMRLPESIFLQTVTGDYPPDTDKAMSPAEIDIILKADPKTVRRVPWAAEPTAQVIHDCFYADGRRVGMAPRGVLRHILEMYANARLGAGGRARARVLPGRTQHRRRLSTQAAGGPLGPRRTRPPELQHRGGQRVRSAVRRHVPVLRRPGHRDRHADPRRRRRADGDQPPARQRARSCRPGIPLQAHGARSGAAPQDVRDVHGQAACQGTGQRHAHSPEHGRHQDAQEHLLERRRHADAAVLLAHRRHAEIPAGGHGAVGA